MFFLLKLIYWFVLFLYICNLKVGVCEHHTGIYSDASESWGIRVLEMGLGITSDGGV
mgnify:CR=1 FL=1